MVEHDPSRMLRAITSLIEQKPRRSEQGENRARRFGTLESVIQAWGARRESRVHIPAYMRRKGRGERLNGVVRSGTRGTHCEKNDLAVRFFVFAAPKVGGEHLRKVLARTDHVSLSKRDAMGALCLTKHCLLYTSPSPRD